MRGGLCSDVVFNTGWTVYPTAKKDKRTIGPV